MVKAIVIPRKEIEKILREKKEHIDFSYKPKKTVKGLVVAVKKPIKEYEIIDFELEKKTAKNLKEELKKTLSKEEQEYLKTSFDQVGKIAIIEIDKKLSHKKKVIGETLLKLFPNIRTVACKLGGHEGELRIQNYEVIAGEDNLATIVVENNIRMYLDISKAYYSVRSSTERKRIASKIENGERVLVMFSGIGPFVLVIAKHTNASEVIGVELNTKAHEYAEKNIRLNKITNARVYQGDVRVVVPEKGLFDRIIMPLPHTAEDFLDTAVNACNKKSKIHLYHFSSEEEVKSFAEKIPEKIRGYGAKATIEHIKRCGNLSPGIHRWCIDIAVKKN